MVYVDRFYTSIDLCKKLIEMGLHVTGTLTLNKLPSQVMLDKKSLAYKELKRGHYFCHRYDYDDKDGNNKKIGLTCWKDKEMVFVLSTHHKTGAHSTCYRRSKNNCVSSSLLLVDWPTIIEDYNNNMDGVDLADQQHFHVQTNVIGLHRWWVRLLFYLLDVSNNNAMILYMQHTNISMNMAQFKRLVANSICGKQI